MASGIEACLFGHAKIDGLGREYQLRVTEATVQPTGTGIT